MEEGFHNFNYGAAFQFAHEVREAIIKEHLDCFIDFASDIDKQINKPQKNTLLHDVIEYIISNFFNVVYFNNNFDVYSIDDVAILEENGVIELFDEYEIEYISLEDYLSNNNNDYFLYGYEYLREVLELKLLPILKEEVFNLLFNDRELMKEFNILISQDLDEKVKRCRTWPKWLERALFCREKGLCALCKKDLTQLLHTKHKPAIDHIVPIAKKGVNDPTNLQMLCNKCNESKSNIEIVTSNSTPLYW